MNTELFGELHEQEEYGLFGKEHERQQCFLVHNVNNKYSKNMKSTKLQRDILRWEYENETKDMYSPPSPIEWLENKLIELRKHAVVGQSEQLACDSCGCHPNVIYTTSKGRFCERCKPAN